MIETADVILDCCKTKLKVSFRHGESPALPPNQFRKNVQCQACKRLVIITMTKAPSGETTVEQEVI